MPTMTDDQSRYAPPKATVADPPTIEEAYFSVGALKLALMSLTTFGLYELYWFYRNWRFIRWREKSHISPFWRAFFGVLWTFSLGNRFRDDAKAQNISVTLPVVALGILYLILSLTSSLPDPYWLLSLLSFLPLLPFDYAARRLTGNGQLVEPTAGRYSGWNIAWLAIGSLFLVLIFAGTFLAEGAD